MCFSLSTLLESWKPWLFNAVFLLRIRKDIMFNEEIGEDLRAKIMNKNKRGVEVRVEG